ncbi:cobalamin biosynthesis protein CobQ [Cochlodiniinecator piscidefendens]|uniref:cobalamin biosynthesis protein CobQ n=1 Tax=Cochlodiniinecator piscidefendens TaxID=2715756 RepID=UPI00140D5EFB|nr:cobalamin biosynthesis protein CobQ [Cochlodiniinecator piscidefendens]
MNTPAHLILGAAFFGKREQVAITTAAVLGGLAPDLSLYLMAGWSLLVMQISPAIVFDEWYFSDAWQQVFAIDNSFILWGIALVIGLWRRSAVLIAFTAAALLHLFTDFLLHHEDARMQFWPLSDWVFRSPVSYWDPSRYGNIFAPIEIIVALIACVVMWKRHPSMLAKVLISIAIVTQIAPGIIWGFVFATSGA